MAVERGLIRQVNGNEIARSIASRTTSVLESRVGGGLRLYGIEAHTAAQADNEREDRSTFSSAETERLQLADYIRGKANLPKDEQMRLGMVVPELMGALALDNNYTTRIYRKDITSLGKIAVDWALNPETVDQTTIRVGYGGDERVTALGPAYVTAAFAMVERVKGVFDLQRNYALLNELMDHTPEGKDRDEWREEVREWFNNAVGEKAQNGKNPEFTTKAEKTLSVKIREGVTQEEITKELTQKWEKELGEASDMEALGKKFFFPTINKVPQIVVFNAAHAAVNLNDMDRDKVLKARDITQNLLKTYAQKVHPEVAHVLHFQNDVPWSNWAYYDRQEPTQDEDDDTTDWWLQQRETGRKEHDLKAAYTKLYLGYEGHVLGRLNGRVAAASDRLENFAKHHKQNGDSKVLGFGRHDLYGYLHTPFFEDMQFNEPNNRLPKTNVMAPVTEPRNTIYLQGRPEITFGVYRKLISEHAKLDEFIEWLEAKKDTPHLLKVAKEVTIIADNYVTDLNIPYEQALQRGIGEWRSRENKKHGFPDKLHRDAKRTMTIEQITLAEKLSNDAAELRINLGQTAFKEAPDKKEAWYNLLADMERVDLGEVTDALEYATKHKKALSDLLYAVNDRELTDEEATSEAAYSIFHPQAQAEFITAVGDTPVYYPVEGIDAVLWPNGELPSLQRYEEHLIELKKKIKAQKGTFGQGISYADQLTKNWAEQLSLQQDSLSGAPEDEAFTAQLVTDLLPTLQKGYDENYALEKTIDPTNAQERDRVLTHLRDVIASTAEQTTQYLISKKGMTFEEASTYILAHDLVKKIATQAKDMLGGANNILLEQSEGRLVDYKAILTDINPQDLQAAEAAYHELLRSMQETTTPTNTQEVMLFTNYATAA